MRREALYVHGIVEAADATRRFSEGNQVTQAREARIVIICIVLQMQRDLFATADCVFTHEPRRQTVTLICPYSSVVLQSIHK